MEFIDEDIKLKPRFHSRIQQSQISQPQIEEKPNKSSIFICFSLFSLLIFLSIFFFQSEILKFMLLWFAFSLIVGPFAPSSVTGGDVRVGRGEVIEFAVQDQMVDEIVDSKKRGLNRRQLKDRSHRSDELGFSSSVPAAPAIFEVSDQDPVDDTGESKKVGFGGPKSDELGLNSTITGESDWNDEDMEMLKKQLLKHPAGKRRRWEIISKAFEGRHGVESVIKQVKWMAEKKPSDDDSFSEFLKHRKPLDKRLETGNEESDVNNGEIKGLDWSSGEDLALLNALKAFPKEAAMRWEKIAATVPGKTKAACVKRVAELKKEFRSSKA